MSTGLQGVIRSITQAMLAPRQLTYEYVRIPTWMIPDDIQAFYHLVDKIQDGYVYAEICGDMYGLPQAG